MRQVDDERGVCCLRNIGVLFGSYDQDREVRSVCVGDEPFMAVDHPLIAILVSTGLNQRWIRTGDVWFSHGETRGCSPFAEGFQIFVELFLSAPVQKRVHVAFIWRLTVQYPRPVMRLSCFCLNHGQLDMSEAHPSPVLGHMRQP